MLEVFHTAFAQPRGVSHVSFELFNDGDTARTRIFEQIRRNEALWANQSLHESITSFFKNSPQQGGNSVWCLKYALESGIAWEKMLDLSLFKNAAQDYGYTTLRQFENTEVGIEEVVNNLHAVYIAIFNHNLIELHRACKEFRLQEHVPEICRANGLVLHPKTLEVLQNADGINIQAQSVNELYKTRGGNPMLTTQQA